MSYKKISLTMKPTKTSRKCQFTTFIFLSIIWTILLTEATARPNLEKLLAKQNDMHVSELFLDELLANGNSEKFVNSLKKYHQKQPSYLDKWPNLRDLVFTVDYDDSSNNMESNEISNMKFFERLHKLAASSAESFDDIRDDSSDTNLMPMKTLKTSTNQIAFKDHNIKKNVQYMSPCHFKICNMGRKRNARLFTNY